MLTTLGVRKWPKAFGISILCPFFHTVTRLFVVPKSIPIIARTRLLFVEQTG